MPTPANLFSPAPEHLPQELCEILASSGNVRIERIVSRAHASPPGFWYDQDQDEFVVLLSGRAMLEFVDGAVEMKPGDYINIPAHARHRVSSTSGDVDCVWLAVHYDGDAAGED